MSVTRQIEIYRAVAEGGQARVQALQIELEHGVWFVSGTVRRFAANSEGSLELLMAEGGWSKTRADALRAGIERLHRLVHDASRSAKALSRLLAEESEG